MLARAAFMKNPVARIAGLKRHIGMVKRLPAAKQAMFHERTVHALHRAMTNDPTGNKGFGLIKAARKLRARSR